MAVRKTDFRTLLYTVRGEKVIYIDQAIVVEGKYDQMHLSSMIDAPIVSTGGFRIYKDTKKVELIRRLAKEKGIIILTDSDAAGFQIRGYIKNILGNLSNVTEVFLPPIKGKEKRKEKASKEGLLGVEGISEEIIKEAFIKAGVLSSDLPLAKSKNLITNVDLFEWGLNGKADSKKKREKLLNKLNFPTYLSGKSLIIALNALYSKAELEAKLLEWNLIERRED